MTEPANLAVHMETGPQVNSIAEPCANQIPVAREPGPLVLFSNVHNRTYPPSLAYIPAHSVVVGFVLRSASPSVLPKRLRVTAPLDLGRPEYGRG